MGYHGRRRSTDKYLTFIEVEQKTKTKVWRVCTGDVPIGRVRWRPGWRRYVFAPSRSTEYDVGCMLEIAKFVQLEMRKHKRKQLQKIINTGTNERGRPPVARVN